MNHFPPARPASPPGRPGRAFRSLLKTLGPSWRSSPLRRATQAAALALFLLLLFHVAWPHVTPFTSAVLVEREIVPAETFLSLDALLAVSTAVAGRVAGGALLWLAAAAVVSLFVPRVFCGYVCPLGTLVDVFDWLVGRRAKKMHVERRGAWAHLRFYILAAVIAAAAFGTLLAGYVAAIPLLNRGLVLTAGAAQLGLAKNWDLVAPFGIAGGASLAALLVVLALGVLGKRFWCRFVCPTGALYSLLGYARLTERVVSSACIECGKCASACPLGAITESYGTRVLDCASCQTCGGVCPTGAISFASRFGAPRDEARGQVGPAAMSRRAFVATAVGGAASAVAVGGTPFGARGADPALLRPPGSVDEETFLRLCIRCGECIKVCPGPTLHATRFEAGLEGFLTPRLVPTRAGCHQDCNFCSQVCPTGAIEPLDLERKRATKIGVAEIDRKACLPHTGAEDCDHCFKTCASAGYDAIEMRKIELEMGEVPEGMFSEMELDAMSHINAPFVDADKCVGCGQCENRCHTVNVRQLAKIETSAVVTKPLGRTR